MPYITTEEEKELKELKTFITLSLNPGNNQRDTDDEKIVFYLNDILRDAINYNNKDNRTMKIKELELSVAFLLKDDWERLKKDMGMAYKKIDRKNKYVEKKVKSKNFFKKLIS